MDDYLKCDFGIQFIHYCTTKSACELTWEALFPSIETPYIIKLLSAYDIWDHDRFDWDKWTLPFQYGMRLDCENIVEKFNTNLFKINFETGNYNSLFQAIYNSGINILNYQLSENKLIIKNSFVDKINGFNAICINNSSHSSLIFDNIYDDNIHDVMVLFYYKKDCWKFSIYSKKEVDCSLIAKSFNGGGHYHAAGFKVDRLNEVFTNNKF
jgi:oligoribonuclease NrnB/cAMP/cGMP phosphodiesterase (DHH superfamily)